MWQGDLCPHFSQRLRAKARGAATMTSLTREESTPFSREDCLTLSQLTEAVEAEDYTWLVPVESTLSAYPVWQVPAEDSHLVKLVENGSASSRAA